MNKLIQIVDSNNTVIGSEDKKTAYLKGLWHRIVCIYVINDKSELFIQ